MKNLFLKTFVSISLVFTSLEALDPSTIFFPSPQTASISHTEGKGLGYTQGYTSLDLFITQPIPQTQFVPFFDFQGHLFNKGKNRWATNAGFGLRWLNPCSNQIWGINSYYDTLSNSRRCYHQFGLGLEFLSNTWEVRLNGYFPGGRKKTNIYLIKYDFTSGFRLKVRKQFAMNGVDAEVGCRLDDIPCINLYAGIGPYVFWGNNSKTKNAFRSTQKHIVGGRLRATAQFFTFFELEGQTTYDSRFKWTGQVTLALNVPFDLNQCFGKSASIPHNENLFQRVIRNDMIVVDKFYRISTNPLVLDPKFEP